MAVGASRRSWWGQWSTWGRKWDPHSVGDPSGVGGNPVHQGHWDFRCACSLWLLSRFLNKGGGWAVTDSPGYHGTSLGALHFLPLLFLRALRHCNSTLLILSFNILFPRLLFKVLKLPEDQVSLLVSLLESSMAPMLRPGLSLFFFVWPSPPDSCNMHYSPISGFPTECCMCVSPSPSQLGRPKVWCSVSYSREDTIVRSGSDGCLLTSG